MLERFGDEGPSQFFDLFRESRETHGGRFFPHIFRETRADLDSPSISPLVSVTAIPETRSIMDSQFPFTDRFDLLASIGVTVGPVTVATGAPAGEASIATPGPDNLVGDDSDRVATALVGATEALRVNGSPMPVFVGNGSAGYVVSYSDRLDGGIMQDSFVWDAATKTLLTGGAGNWPELGAGPDDTLELSGDFSAGFELPGQPAGLDTIVLNAGSDYNLFANDNHVAAGETLTINAMRLGADNHVVFDGSAETDGNFEFFGSQSGDFFFGGAGDDRIVGLAGGDSLAGGGGSDIFVYTGAADSSGTDYDTIADFDPAADRIDLPGAVAGFGDAIEGGTLSTATFNDDLAAALAGLEAAQAVWFAPDAGDLAGQIFLIVDGNGQPGYQEGEDFVIAVAGAPLVDLTGHTDIFI